MGSTIDLNSTTPVTTKLAVHTSSYSEQTFGLRSGEFRYFEISTTEDWEHSIEIGAYATKSGYVVGNDKFTGYEIYILMGELLIAGLLCKAIMLELLVNMFE